MNKSESKTPKWLIQGLIWGLIMFIWMEVVGEEEYTTSRLIIGFVTWLLAGIVFGLLMRWLIHQKK